ncbi:hypothetical protein FACS1894122_05120 [Alphaproteobacteria bacterium]|nr:hypothetical protein FACS1894122_05120 [Alphaproteobacteria bacterium]
MKKLFVKTLSITALMLSLTTCYSIEFLSREGREAAEKFKHAEFDVSDGGLKGIKLKMTPELSAYRKDTEKHIIKELHALFSKNYPATSQKDKEEYCNKFLLVKDDNPSLNWDYIGGIIRSYISNINSLLSLNETIRQSVIDEVGSLLRESLTKYRDDLSIHLASSQITYEARKMYASFFLKHDEANLLNFSEKISPELFAELSQEQKNAYGFKSENIRIITANSILKALGNLAIFGKERESFYRGLLHSESNPKLLTLYEKLFDDADKASEISVSSELIVNFDTLVKTNAAEVELYKKNFMENVRISLSSNSGRQALVLFLAAHEYESKSSEKEKLIFSSASETGKAEYPIFDVNFSSDINTLVLPKFEGEISILGYKKASKKDISALFRHELKHAVNGICGLAGSVFDRRYSEYHEEYMNNPFLKDLLFSDVDKMRIEIKASIATFLGKLSKEEKVAFVDSMKEFCDIALSYEAEKDEDKFVDDVAFKLAVTVTDVWNLPEEINNIIGVQLVGDVLYVNMLSDLDSSLEKQEAFRWTHMYDFDALDEQKSEVRLVSLTDQNARTFMKEFYTKYITSPFNHPTEKALNTLLKLHGIKS